MACSHIFASLEDELEGVVSERGGAGDIEFVFVHGIGLDPFRSLCVSAHTASPSWRRSRCACQPITGSEPTSQSTTEASPDITTTYNPPTPASVRMREPKRRNSFIGPYHCDMAIDLPVRVLVERGKKKRVVACAFDWPGWDRSAPISEDPLVVLETYRARYAIVANQAGLETEFRAAGPFKVVEQVEGIGMTDYYGLSGRAASDEHDPMTDPQCERKIALLRSAWHTFDDTAARVSPELRKGPRGGGRETNAIVHHVNGAEINEFAPKVGVKVSADVCDDPATLHAYRDAFVAAIRVHHHRNEPARSWALQFLIRRCAWHMLDHAWELEDRDLTACEM